jgi:hypothetical protein
MLVHTLMGSVTGGILIYKNYPELNADNIDDMIHNLALLNSRAFSKKDKTATA